MTEDAAAAAEPPVPESCMPAAVPPALVADDRQPAHVAAADCVDEPKEVSEVAVEPQRSSSRVTHKRARGDDLASTTTSALSAAAASAAASTDPVAPEPTVAPVAVPASEFKERAGLMFKLDADGPVASGRLPATHVVSKKHVQFAWWAANDVCDDRGPALSAAYGNFDKLVACGWLLGDVALGRLIEKTDAFKVGRKAGKLAPGLKAEFDAPARRLGKRKQPASEEEWAEAAREEEATRREAVNLPFPDAPPPIAPSVAPPPSVALQRHRVESMPPPPPRPPGPRPPPAPVTNDPERLALLKQLMSAESAVAAAECAVAAAKRELDKRKADCGTTRVSRPLTLVASRRSRTISGQHGANGTVRKWRQFACASTQPSVPWASLRMPSSGPSMRPRRRALTSISTRRSAADGRIRPSVRGFCRPLTTGKSARLKPALQRTMPCATQATRSIGIRVQERLPSCMTGGERSRRTRCERDVHSA